MMNKPARSYYALWIHIVLFLTGMGLAMHAWSQNATATIDTTSIRLGEQVQLKLNITLPKAAILSWPQFSDTLFAPVEIVATSRVDTLKTSSANYLQYKQALTVTCFDTGYHTIPAVAFEYRLPGESTPSRAVTDSLILHVRTIEVDTTRAIRDIKPTMHAPLTLAELWPVFAGIAIVGFLVAAIWYYLWRRKQNKPFFPVIRKPQLPPWQVALLELDRIESKNLWQSDKVKLFYTEVTDVLRTYLENQFQVPAMEMISSEILEAMDANSTLKPSKEKVWQVLQLADLVKFAKEIPLPAENQLSLANTRAFIIETKPLEIKEKPTTDSSKSKPTQGE